LRCSPETAVTFDWVQSEIPGVADRYGAGHTSGLRCLAGAYTQTKGRFQMANGGTLFLNEIGDMPLEIQPKLLRALQEREFERLGSGQTVRVDVRVVAATNQDLAQLVAKKLFRADLFYRLNVIPICLPPLRERVQDIPPLTEFFVAKFAASLNKPINLIPDEVMVVLKAHGWPGNIRELQNFIERAVLFSPGSVLRLPLDLKQTVKQNSESALRTLADADREHILETLKQTDWMIGGQDGAADWGEVAQLWPFDVLRQTVEDEDSEGCKTLLRFLLSKLGVQLPKGVLTPFRGKPERPKETESIYRAWIAQGRPKLTWRVCEDFARRFYPHEFEQAKSDLGLRNKLRNRIRVTILRHEVAVTKLESIS